MKITVENNGSISSVIFDELRSLDRVLDKFSTCLAGVDFGDYEFTVEEEDD